MHSSVPCTSVIRVGLTREDGRPTLLEEVGTVNKKWEALGKTAGKSIEVDLRGNRHLEVPLEEVRVSSAFWKVSAAVEGPGVRMSGSILDEQCG